MNTKKKILFLVTQSEFGGAQRFIYTLVNNLNKDRYDIIVCAGTEGDDKNGLLKLLDNQGIKIERLKYLKRSINPFFDFGLGLIEIYRLLKKEKPDVLFLCSSKAGAMGSLIGRLVKVPKIIYRIGGWTFNDPRNFLANFYYKFIEKNSAKWKDYIVNNAESDKQQAIKLGIKPKKEIIVIYNGIEVNGLEFLSKEEARQKIMQICGYNADLRIADNQQSVLSASNQHIRIMIGTIANDYPSKGLKYLKRAMENINGELVIIGKGSQYIPNAYKYLKAFDVFVLPSVKEGFPWVILEALKAEIPVIATKVGAIPEIILNNENGILIESRSPKAIIDAIEKLLNDPDLREKLAKAGKKTVEEKFNLNQMVDKYIKLFDDADNPQSAISA